MERPKRVRNPSAAVRGAAVTKAALEQKRNKRSGHDKRYQEKQIQKKNSTSGGSSTSKTAANPSTSKRASATKKTTTKGDKDKGGSKRKGPAAVTQASKGDDSSQDTTNSFLEGAEATVSNYRKKKRRRGGSIATDSILDSSQEDPPEDSQPTESQWVDTEGNALESQDIMDSKRLIVLQICPFTSKRGHPKFTSRAGFITNKVRSEKGIDCQKAVIMEGITYKDKWDSVVLPKIAQFMEETVGAELVQSTTGASVYCCEKPPSEFYYNQVDTALEKAKIIPITSTSDWQHAILNSAIYTQGEEGALTWLHFVVQCQAKEQPKPSRRSSQSQRQSESQEDLAPIQEEETPIDLSDILEWGYGKTLKLCIQGPTYETEGSSGQFSVNPRKTAFTDEETYVLEPPYTEAELREEDDPTMLNYRWRFKIVEDLIRATAFNLPSYKGTNGRTLIGDQSQFFFQPNHSTAAAIEIKNTGDLWEAAQKRWANQTKPQKDSNAPIELRVSVGAMATSDDEYRMKNYFYAEQPEFDDEGNEIIYSVYAAREMDIRPGNIPNLESISQTQELFAQRMKPPLLPTKSSAAARRQDQNTAVPQLESYLWRLHQSEDSHLKEAFTMEHYRDLKDYWLTHRVDGRSIMDLYSCSDGDPSTWPPLSEIPDHIRLPEGDRFYGQEIGRGNHPARCSDTPGSYKSYKKTQRQLEEEKQERRQQSLLTLANAFSGGIHGASSSPSTYVIRIVLDASWTLTSVGQCFVDLPVKADDTGTLKDLYGDQQVKDRVRSCFNGDLEKVQDIGANRAELVLDYKNSNTGDLYCQYPVESLSNHTIQSLIQSIPSNNNGPLEGAFAPVTLYIGSRPIISPVDGVFL